MTKKEIYNELKEFALANGLKVYKNGNYITIFGDEEKRNVQGWRWSDIFPENLKEYLELVKWEATDTILLFVRVKINIGIKLGRGFW